ncbi:MAG TPA: hypothetical protein VJ723_13475 [Candidatus Angelobacter sp.]|nr:hypothetical protein [Candidatus Angelobacter sp.]
MDTQNQVECSTLASPDELPGDAEEDTQLLSKMAEEAKLFLRSLDWCKTIHDGWLGWGVGGVVAVFLFKVATSGNVDHLLWVITGDLPATYLIADEAPTPLAALAIYVKLIQAWINAVHQGASTDNCILVTLAPTSENADELQIRIDFIRQQFLDD